MGTDTTLILSSLAVSNKILKFCRLSDCCTVPVQQISSDLVRLWQGHQAGQHGTIGGRAAAAAGPGTGGAAAEGAGTEVPRLGLRRLQEARPEAEGRPPQDWHAVSDL